MCDRQNTDGKPYDLEERTGQFGESVIRFARTIPLDAITRPLVSQLVRSATSVGANYLEANDSESRQDLRHKAALRRKEARETKHWFRMIVAAVPTTRQAAAPLWREPKELNLIFSAMVRNITRQLEEAR